MSKVVLPSVLAIGFTGHRALADETASRGQIVRLLTELKTGAPGIVCGISSIAAGADLLFAESCLELGLPLRVLLPMPAEDFRADFDAPTWARAERVLEHAISTDVTGRTGDREALYYECGVQTVVQSNVMIALWDGEPPQGLGGTQQIVTFAKAEGRPVFWIHSRTGAVERVNCEHALEPDAELEFLNALPESPGATAPVAPVDVVHAWFRKLDANATLAAPHVRRIAALPILCTAAASIFGTIASIAHGSVLWLAISTALGLVAVALSVFTKIQRRQMRWARIRTAAEICRSSLAFWKAPGPYTLVGPEAVPELAGLLASLNFVKTSAGAGRDTPIDAFREEYRRDRIQGQLRYFSRYADVAQRKARRYGIVTTVCIAAALAANVWTLVDKAALAELTPAQWKPALELTGTVLFQIATIIGALLAMNDYNRRRQRYREMQRLLERWDRQLQVAATWSVLLQIAGRVERALLAEIIEWRSLIRHRKLANK
jgi:hypothetical protein